MNHTTKFRRAAVWAVLSVGAHAAFADDATQSIDSIRKTAQVFVQSRVPGQPNTVQVSVGTLDPRLRLAQCSEPLQASLPAGAVFKERVTVAVTCPGANRWTVYVPVTIATNVTTLILRHAAARGARLTAEDVEVQVRDLPGTSAGYLTDVSQLKGRTLRRTLSPGSALTVDVMQDDTVVKRGQQVTLLASAGGLEVRAPGRALTDAPAAGRVRVQNLSSQQVVEGVVENGSVIRVTP
jgi:flagella basal body P-ring formation protein FlgA